MIEINNTTSEDINLAKLNDLAQSFLDYHDMSDNLVSIAFISKEEMQRINHEYRGYDKNTDVLSFLSSGDDNYLGEILLNSDQINMQAKDLKHSFEKELDFILIHGLLHLLGYTDESEREREEMIDLGNSFLEKYYNKSLF